MPQVPVLQNQVRLSPLPGLNVQTLRPTAGASIGGALERIGAEEQRKADRASFVEASTALSDAENALLFDPQKGAYAKRGKDAFGLPNQVLPEYDRRTAEIAGGLKTDTQRQAFEEEATQRRTQIVRDLGRHEYGERERYYDETDEALIGSSIASAARSASDPQRIATEIAKQQAVLGGMAKRKGWDEAQTAQKRIGIESKTHEAVVNALLMRQQFDEASRYLSSVVNYGALTDYAMKSARRTELSAGDEQKYRAWLQSIGMTRENGYRIDENFTGTDYDLRGFFSKYGPVNVKTGQHLTDEFKLPNHETFSNESRYATGLATRLAGKWNGDTFVPPVKGQITDEVAEQLQKRILIEEEQQAARAERQRRQLSDDMAKEGDRLFATGGLTPAWIERNRNVLDAGDYRYFYTKLRGGESGPGNPMLYADLRDRAGRGEDVREDARKALQKGQIGTSDYDRILGEVEGGRPGWYKRGKDFISTSAAVSDLNPDPAGAQRKAAMINDWDDWSRANPKATEEQASQAYQRIVREYAIVDYSKMALMKRSPQFLAGTRNAPDFDATELATVKAFDEGRITQAEFEQQARLIKEWRESFVRTQQGKPSK